MPTLNRAVVWIGGAAGDGIASAGDILCRTATRSRLSVMEYNSYQSVIRGGHVILHVQVAGEPIYTHGDRCDLIVALNQETVDYHLKSLNALPGRGVIFNSDKIKLDLARLPAGTKAYPLPVGELTAEYGRNPIMQNTVALGALMFLLNLDWSIFEKTVRDQFGKKKAELGDLNVSMAKKGYDYARAQWATLPDIRLVSDGKDRVLMTGNYAIALGAVAGGCKFYAAYPMTPASSIMHWLAPRASKYGMVMKQAEDEIAAVNMAIGAGFSGVRAMTGTSGGGFSLMTEAIGMSGMTEVPVVIVNVQRGGPSTGLPTKTEQADLFQMLGASQGEFPRVVIAPLSVQDAYYATVESLNLAEKYQLPVLLLSDLLLSEHTETVEAAALTNHVPIERGELLEDWTSDTPYQRYKNTPSGVSPRVLPGTANALYTSTTDEHNEDGLIISDIFTNPTERTKMVEKRFRKLEGVLKDTKPFVKEGPASADLTLVGWGSTYKTLQAVRLELEKSGASVNHLQFRTLWPLNADVVTQELKNARKTVCVENNFSGLFAKLVRQETGLSFTYHIRKYDGEPFYLTSLIDKVRACLSGSAKPVDHLVTSEMDIPVKRVAVSA